MMLEEREKEAWKSVGCDIKVLGWTIQMKRMNVWCVQCVCVCTCHMPVCEADLDTG